jgi:hypothetical protein
LHRLPVVVLRSPFGIVEEFGGGATRRLSQFRVRAVPGNKPTTTRSQNQPLGVVLISNRNTAV